MGARAAPTPPPAAHQVQYHATQWYSGAVKVVSVYLPPFERMVAGVLTDEEMQRVQALMRRLTEES